MIIDHRKGKRSVYLYGIPFHGPHVHENAPMELFIIVFSVDDDKLTRATMSTKYVVTYEEPTASGLGAAIVENIIYVFRRST